MERNRKPGPRPELEVRLFQIVIQDAQVLALPGEGLAGRSMLQDLSHSPQGVALGGRQRAARCHGHNVKGVGGHNSRVQEAVVQKVPHHLQAEETVVEAPVVHLHSPSPALPAQQVGRTPWVNPIIV